MHMLCNFSSEGVGADCHDFYSSRSANNSAYYLNKGPRYDDREYYTHSDSYNNKKQINHHRSREKRDTNDGNIGYDHTAKDGFGSIASGDYFILTFDKNSVLGRSESHTENNSSSEFVGTISSNEHSSSETEDVNHAKAKQYALSHSPMQNQQNDKRSVSPSLPNNSTSYRNFIRRNQRHSSHKHNDKVSEETNDSFNHLLPSENLEHNTAFPYTTSKEDSFSYIASDEDRRTYEDMSWVHYFGAQDFSNKDANFLETDSFWKDNADDEVNNTLPRYNKARNESNAHHKRVEHYDAQNTKAKHPRKHQNYNPKGTTHEETEENISDEMDHTSLSPAIHRSLSDNAISAYTKNDTTVNKKQQTFSNTFGRKVTEGQYNNNFNGKSEIQSETNNADSKEIYEFMNMHEHKIKLDADSINKKKQLNSLQNNKSLINSNKEETIVGINDDPIILTPNQIHYHNQENSTTDSGIPFSSETQQESQDTHRINKTWNASEVEPKIVYPSDSINQHEDVKNSEYPGDTTEDKREEDASERNLDETDNRSETVRWKRFETNRQSSNMNLSKVHRQTVPINTVNKNGSSPGFKSRVKPPYTVTARNRERPFFKQGNKLFGTELHQITQYLDDKDQDMGKLFIKNSPTYLHEKDKSTKLDNDSVHPVSSHNDDYHSDPEIYKSTGLDQYNSITHGNNLKTDMKLSDQIYSDLSFVRNDKEIIGYFPHQSKGILFSVENNEGGYRQGDNNRNEYNLKYKQGGIEEGHTTIPIYAQNGKEYTREQKGKDMPIEEKANTIDYTTSSYPCSKHSDTLSQQQNKKLKKDAHNIETLAQDAGSINIYRKTGPWDYFSHHTNHDRSSKDEINIEDSIKDHRTLVFREASYNPKFYAKTDKRKISESNSYINKEESEHCRCSNVETNLDDNLNNYQTGDFKGTRHHPNVKIKVENIKKSFSPTNNENHGDKENALPNLFRQFNETYFIKHTPQNASPYGITWELNNESFPGNKANLIRSNIRPSIHIKDEKLIEETHYSPVSFQRTASNLQYNNDKISPGTMHRNTDRIAVPDYNSHSLMPHLNKSKSKGNATGKKEDLSIQLRADAVQLQIEESISKMLGKHGLADMNISSSNINDWGHMKKQILNDVKMNYYNAERSHPEINSNAGFKTNEIGFKSKIKLPCKIHKGDTDTGLYTHIRQCDLRNNINHPKTTKYYDKIKRYEEQKGPTNVVNKSEGRHFAVHETFKLPRNKKGKLVPTGVREGVKQSPCRNKVLNVSCMGKCVRKCKECTQEDRDHKISKAIADNKAVETVIPSLLDKVILFNTDNIDAIRKRQKYEGEVKEYDLDEWKTGNMYGYSTQNDGKLVHESQYNRPTSASEKKLLSEKLYNQRHSSLPRIPLDQIFQTEEDKVFENLNRNEKYRLEPKKTNTQPKHSFLSKVGNHISKGKESHTDPIKHITDYPGVIHPHEHSEYTEASSIGNKKSKHYSYKLPPQVIAKYVPAHYRHYEEYSPSEKLDLHRPQRRSQHSHEVYPREIPDSDVRLETQIRSPYVSDEY